MRIKRVICLITLLCVIATGLPALQQRAEAAARYYITVDLTNQIVTVYDNGNVTNSGIARQMICSTGKSGTATPTGTYTLPSKWYGKERTEWYYFPKYNCYAKWATRIVGGILFHSVLYTAAKSGPTRSSVNALGSRASHGCVRLRVNDAKWIAQNCPAGTRCRIYSSGKTNSALRKRLLKNSFSRGSETYAQFLGGDPVDGQTSGGKLSRGSSGAKVRQLQTRLRELGFLNDVSDGKFGPKAEQGVRYFQAACGLKQTGEVDEDLWNRAFADDAPTGFYVPLSGGMNGPAVAALQRALSALKLYDGAADGSYDAPTAEAVEAFQRQFGYEVNGKASPALQSDAAGRAAELKARFGDGEYLRVAVEAPVAMARVKGKAYVHLRSKASSKGKSLAKVKKKQEVLVLSVGKKWTKVACGTLTGYLMNKYLTYFTGTQTTVSYEPATPEVFIPETTPEPPSDETPEEAAEPTPEVFIPGAGEPEENATLPDPWDLFVLAPPPGPDGEAEGPALDPETGLAIEFEEAPADEAGLEQPVDPSAEE